MTDNATCPKCRHYNAMLGADDGGTECRDCGHHVPDPSFREIEEDWRRGEEDCRRERKSFATAQELARVGRSTREAKALVKAASKLHRTEQQFVTNACLAWLQHLSELGAHQVDARNEASFTVANEIMSAVPRARYGLPLI